MESFSDNYIELSTNLGMISVEGKDLKIESLDQKTKNIYVVGDIGGIFYSESRSSKGFWNKLFK